MKYSHTWPDGQSHSIEVPDALIETALKTQDPDEAVLPIQSHLGIDDGMLCGMVMDRDEWTNSPDTRREQLDEWLRAECVHGGPNATED